MNPPLALIIEDDSKLSNIFSLTLQSAEFNTEVALDGQVAMKRLANLIPDIILLDLHLPHISGIDILRRIKSDDRLAKTKVMVATADALLAEELQDEADLILLKPISTSQLRDLAVRFRPLDLSSDN